MIRHNPSIIEFYICTLIIPQNQKNTYTTRASFYFWLSQPIVLRLLPQPLLLLLLLPLLLSHKFNGCNMLLLPLYPNPKIWSSNKAFQQSFEAQTLSSFCQDQKLYTQDQMLLERRGQYFFFSLIFLFPVTVARILTAQLLFFTEEDPENQHQSPTFFFFLF